MRPSPFWVRLVASFASIRRMAPWRDAHNGRPVRRLWRAFDTACRTVLRVDGRKATGEKLAAPFGRPAKIEAYIDDV
ncbi:hypothetical protein [Aureimonas mangrovi]|uniref:hypothetical protein n=1 Tax=Aureimonas mangrovi TaxID=2758041 RepID=UPI00163DD2EE|nr:hypothetical protein [Aureimonas mangrovi]